MNSNGPSKKKARFTKNGDKKRYDFLQTVRKRDQWVLLKEHPEYQDDDEIVRIACFNHPLAFQFASPRLRNDSDLASRVVAVDINCMASVSNELKDDKEFCIGLLDRPLGRPSNSGVVFGLFSDRLRNDRDIVSKFVKVHDGGLQRVREDFRADPQVVAAAVANNGNALQYASEELRGNKQLAMDAISNRIHRRDNFGRGHSVLQFLSEALRDNDQVVEAALEGHGYEIYHASDRLQNNPKMVASALSNLRNIYRSRVGEVQALILLNDRCLQLKARLDRLKSMLQGHKFPAVRRTPALLADRLVKDTVYSKWLCQEICSEHGLPGEVGDCIFGFTGTTKDDIFVSREIREMAPFLTKAADKFVPRYVSWWVFLTGKSTGWFENTSLTHNVM